MRHDPLYFIQNAMNEINDTDISENSTEAYRHLKKASDLLISEIDKIDTSDKEPIQYIDITSEQGEAGIMAVPDDFKDIINDSLRTKHSGKISISCNNKIVHGRWKVHEKES